jgi:serine/threonine-protein kinase RsbW
MATNMENEIILTAPNIPEMELMVSEIASSIAESAKLTSEQADEIKMAVIEVCLNSFEHSKSEDKYVVIKFLPLDDGLKITIQDKGKGFDPSKVKAPELRKIISGEEKRHRGWGLKIVNSLMDEVKIASGNEGTIITLFKKKKAINKA